MKLQKPTTLGILVMLFTRLTRLQPTVQNIWCHSSSMGDVGVLYVPLYIGFGTILKVQSGTKVLKFPKPELKFYWSAFTGFSMLKWHLNLTAPTRKPLNTIQITQHLV